MITCNLAAFQLCQVTVHLFLWLRNVYRAAQNIIWLDYTLDYLLFIVQLQAIYDMLGACSSNRPADSAEERAKNIFAKMDENNDGQLTQDEFLKGCLQDEELSKMLAP